MNGRPVADILLEITGRRRERVPAIAPAAAPARSGGHSLAATLDNRFLAALAACRGRAIIAEVKMGSPRLGSLEGKVDPERQARAYATHGAAALSVVVEPDFFHGSYELLARCKSESGLPAIAKDFVVSERQLDWALDAGADAVLLVAALHSADELRAYAAAARERGLVPLVETHDLEDVDKLGGDPWELVGVNNRDLRTFQVDVENSIALAPRLPAAALKVAESAIRDRNDIARLRVCGFDAFLVGEILLLAAEPGRVLEELQA